MSETIADLQNVCLEMKELRNQIDRLEDQKKEFNEKLTNLKSIAVGMLENHGLNNFNYGEGKISITERKSVKIEDKYKLFDWLKAQGTFEDVISVNAQKANSIYKEEFEAAQERGDIEFLTQGIPGLSQPTTFRDIRFLK